MKISDRKKSDRAPKYTAIFSVIQPIGNDSPFLVCHILKNDESWHEVVRGDGHSYSSVCTTKPIPEDMIKSETLSLKDFEEQSRDIVYAWNCIPENIAWKDEVVFFKNLHSVIEQRKVWNQSKHEAYELFTPIIIGME